MPFLSTIWFLLFLVFLNQPAAWAEPLRNAAERPAVSELAAPLHSYNFGLDLISQDRNVAGNWVENFYGYDGHGSTRYLTDAAGSVTDEYSYDAYGILLTTSGSTVISYLYCGEQFDADLGLYYLRARYLNQDSGRFWTRDTFEGFGTDPISLHKYLYGNDDPVQFIDPSGQSGLLAQSQLVLAQIAIKAAPYVAGATLVARRYGDRIANGARWLQQLATSAFNHGNNLLVYNQRLVDEGGNHVGRFRMDLLIGRAVGNGKTFNTMVEGKAIPLNL